MAALARIVLYSLLVLALQANFVYPLLQFSPAPAPSPTSPSPTPTPMPPAPAPSITPSSPTPSADIPPPPPLLKKKESKGMSGGKKAGVVFGVLIGAGLLGFAGYVYKIRSDNIRRERLSLGARNTML